MPRESGGFQLTAGKISQEQQLMFPALCECGVFSSLPIGPFFPEAGWFPRSHALTRIPPFPSVSLLNPVLQTPAATVSLDSRLCLLTSGHVPDSLWLLFLCTPLGRELFRLEQLRGQLPGFLSLRDACPSLPDVQCLENHA